LARLPKLGALGIDVRRIGVRYEFVASALVHVRRKQWNAEPEYSIRDEVYGEYTHKRVFRRSFQVGVREGRRVLFQ
jgi:hypothetical protein